MIISIKSNLKHNETYYCLRKQKLTKISKPSNFACKHTVYAEQFIIKFDQNITKLNNDVQNQINSDIARVIKNQTLQDHSIQKSLLQDLTHFNKKLSEVENGYIGSIFFQLEKEMILNQLLNTLKHEITNPISGVDLASEYLKDISLSKEIVQEIKKSTFKIKSLIKPLPDNEKADIFQVANKILFKNYKLFHQKIRFEIFGQEDIKIQQPSSQVNQILENVIQNAFESANEVDNGYVWCRITQVENTFTIQVGDNGNIPSNPEKLFSPFFTTKKNGTGLGLYITKLLCEDLGLRISYEENKSKRFIINGRT